MSDPIQAMLNSGYLKPEELEKVSERVSEFMDVLELDRELMDEAIQKLAGPTFWESLKGGFQRAMPLTLAAAASTAAVAGASGLAQEAVHAIRDSLGKAKAYKQMVDSSGERLKGIPAEKVQESFNTLYRVNPDIANDPAVAAEFVRETSRYEAYPFQLLRAMADMRGEGDAGWERFQKMVPATAITGK